MAIVIVGFGGYSAYNYFNLSKTLEDTGKGRNLIASDDISYCVIASDCVAVECECDCIGCGGFSYDDVINRQYINTWHERQGCEPAEFCPDVCCPPRTIVCENNLCAVKEG